MGRKGKVKFPPGTWVERDMFESRAFLSLKGFAPQLLILILGRRRFERSGRTGKVERVCVNCDSLCFTYVEAEKKYGITQPRFTRAIDELLAKGFITIKHSGGGYKQDRAIYGLSEKWTFWSPGTVSEQRPRDPVQRGWRRPNRRK